ncbi:MAG: glycosyltransferase [Actinomycetota bacterium]
MPTVLETDRGLSLQRGLHRLWVDHVVWTRQYIVSAIAGAPDAEAAAGRLLKNQEDIGNAIVPFYGEEAGAAVTGLLKEHIMIAVDLIDAALKDDKKRFNDADQRWDANAAEIAALVSSVNPFWPEKDVQDLLSLHLALTRREAVARLEGNWQDDVAAFDDILTEILTLSDVLAAGIVQQFPDRFGGQGATGAGNGTPNGHAGSQAPQAKALTPEASLLPPRAIRWR